MSIKRLAELITEFGVKHWSFAARRDPDYLAWIDEQTSDLPSETPFAVRVYCATTGERPMCENGGERKLKSVIAGWGYCGTAGRCACAREGVSASVRASKEIETQAAREASQAKREATNIERYGHRNTGQTEAARAAHKSFYDDPSSAENAVEKNRITMLARHGVPNALNLPAVEHYRYNQDKIISPEARKRGGEIRRQQAKERRTALVKSYQRIREKYRSLGYEILDSVDRYTGVSDQTYYDFRCLKCELLFADYIDNGHLPTCPKCDVAVPRFQSKPENEIAAFIESFGFRTIRNSQKIVKGSQIDIYVPDRMLAIEHDGLYWHSELSQGKDKYYHLNKTNACAEQGIRLIHVFGDEWLNKREICESRLKALLGVNENRAFGRNTRHIDLDFRTANDFLDGYHIQGKCNGSKYHYGLELEGKIVGVMTVGRPRHFLGKADPNQWELYRFATDGIVVGGASKMFKRFIKEVCPQSVMSFCDRRWGSGNVYRMLGFDWVGDSVPGYWWVEKYLIRHHRYNFNKQSLIKDGYNLSLTEDEIMFSRGFDRIWDCGVSSYEWSPNK